MWFCLRKRKTKQAQQNQENVGYDQGGYNQQYPSGQNPKEMYSPTVTNDPQPGQHQTETHGQYIAEAPGSKTPAQPAELWQGNYRS